MAKSELKNVCLSVSEMRGVFVNILTADVTCSLEFQNVCLSTSEFLLVLFNTLTADEKYSLYNKKNLLQPIQLQLSKKQKICSQFFHGYLKCTSNFEHF